MCVCVCVCIYIYIYIYIGLRLFGPLATSPASTRPPCSQVSSIHAELPIPCTLLRDVRGKNGDSTNLRNLCKPPQDTCDER